MRIKRNVKLDAILVILGIVSLIVFIRIYPLLIPDLAGGYQLKGEEAITLAEKYLGNWGYKTSEFQYFSGLFRNDELIRYFESRYGLVMGNELMRPYPILYWNLEYAKLKDREREFVVSVDRVRRLGQADIIIKMDVRGNLIELRRHLADTVSGARLTEMEAKEIAVEALSKHVMLEDMTFGGTSTIQLEDRTDYKFNWTRPAGSDSLVINAEVLIQGDKLGGLNLSYRVPRVEESDGIQSAWKLMDGILYVAFIITMIIFLFLRVRANELDFKAGLFWGALAAVGFFAMLLAQTSLLSGGSLWQSIFGGAVGGIFLGAFVWLVWTTSDSVGREIWNEKLYTMGRISKGKILYETVGTATLRGIAVGLLFLGISSLFYFVVDRWVPLYFDFVDSSGSLSQPLGYSIPALLLVGTIAIGFPLQQALIVLFGSSVLKKYLKSNTAVVISGGLIFSVIGLHFSENLEPFGISLVVNILWGVLYIFTFIRFDFLTSFVCGLTIHFVRHATLLTSIHHSDIYYNGLFFWIMIGLMAVVGAIAYLRREEVDIEAYTPSYVKRITDRERMEKELEAARNIQQSFLPRSTPKFEGLDISALCIPAYEVGGDYYDFINLGDKKLGILIGDVSGKGITAAFYMTLTKGIMKAQAQHSQSPKEVITRVNDLLYDSMDRGNFISMIYGIFDIEQRTFTFTDAGLNPPFFRNRSNEQLVLLRTNGLALGLEEGKIFAETIGEQTVPVLAGDTFVFYTDGFVEAMNKVREEFGEDRLKKVVNENIGAASHVIMASCIEAVKDFVGKAKQHDDMTMVVVKVLT
jgi:hypothetical protein